MDHVVGHETRHRPAEKEAQIGVLAPAIPVELQLGDNLCPTRPQPWELVEDQNPSSGTQQLPQPLEHVAPVPCVQAHAPGLSGQIAQELRDLYLGPRPLDTLEEEHVALLRHRLGD